MKPWTCQCSARLLTESMTFKIVKHPKLPESVFIEAKCKRCKKSYLHVAKLEARNPFGGFAELTNGEHSL